MTGLESVDRGGHVGGAPDRAAVRPRVDTIGSGALAAEVILLEIAIAFAEASM